MSDKEMELVRHVITEMRKAGLEIVLSDDLARTTSLHHELVAALENVRAAIMEDTTALSDTLWLPERISKNETVVDYIDAVLAKAKQGDKQ